ncbi:MAG: CusA/CzcA family heavy metal efflux RND transporter [Saprospiraceae bacterium]|jgi:cobalt-zinc-cadmium resistance protein CzcA|nr:CusA/CzcA family heavy metal efflux RND transporter [Saprospiraceae bacterium]
MLDKIIYFSIKNKFIVGLFTLALVVWGIFSLSRLPVDALPDITNNQVQVITTSPTLAAQEVEKFITYPIEQAVKPIPKIIELRSISRFGLSVVTVVFEEEVDIFWARTQISERLKEAEGNIPPGMGTPELAPISTGLGEIYQYVVFPKPGFEDNYNAIDLRTVQDWIIKPQLIGTPGVAEVNTLGGLLKQYEIAVQPDKLRSMNTTMPEILEALERNNENTGGAYIDKKPNAWFIRGIGMVNGLDDIQKIVVKNRNGIPILVRDVATVQFGSSIRYGATTKDGKGEAVSGMVMMLKGANSAEVVTLVKEKMEQIRKSLPEGVDVEPFLDRTKLVKNAIGTVQTNLLEGALIVIFILILLLGNLRAGLVVASVIPLSLLFAVSLMNFFGVSGNLMSLGAIDFGLIVDGAVIIVEAIVHRLQITDRGKLSTAQMDDAVYQASSKIRGSAAFGEIIILIVYLPILALIGIEGKMFRPMAQTVSFAILGAFILSLTYVPMMSALFLSKKTGHTQNISDRIIAFCYRIYAPFLEGAFKIKALVVGIALMLLAVSMFVFNRLGGEFIPTLDEGNIATHVIIPPGSSLSQEIETTTKAEQMLKEKFPEIREIVSKIGSAEVPTDPMPMEAADVMIIMNDRKEWTSAKTREEMMSKMEATLDNIPGVTTEFTQPIQMRFNELMTGVRSDVAVKIFGEDIDLLSGLAEQAMPLVQNVEGVEDARPEAVSGLPQITVKYNKDKLALYGLNVGDLNQVVRTGFAGEKAGVVYEGEKRFDLVVRLQYDSRQDIGNLKNLFVSLPSGSQIPLEQVAEIKFEPGPIQVSREDGKRRIVIGFNVRGRDVKSVVNEIRANLDAKLKMPPGYFITYGGQFENLVKANKRLSIAVPIALALIFVLLFFTFNSVKQSLLIFTAIPLSAIGGVFALWMRGMPFSISAGVGFIALFGVAVLNGIVLIGYFNQLKSEGMADVLQRIREGTKVRLRPVIMTASVASLGFLPMALSTGPGAEVQKPLATVVIGGLITATLLTLIVLPILYYLFEEKLKGGRKNAAPLAAVLVLCFCFSKKTTAQTPPLSLPEALDLAQQNNPLLQANAFEIQSHEAMQQAAGILPKTDFVAQLGQYNTRRFDQNFSVSQDIPNPSTLRARRTLATRQTGVAQSQLAISRSELMFNVRQSWFQIQYLMALEKVLVREDSLLQQFVRAASLKLKTGESNLLEKTTAETRQKNLLQNIEQVRVSIETEKSSLRQWLNLPGDFSVQELPFLATDFSEITDTSLLRNNPQLRFAQNQIALAEAEKRLANAERLPDFRAGYFIQSLAGAQEVDGQLVNYNAVPRFQGVQLGISVPIFGAKGYRAKTEAADLQIMAQQKHGEYLQAQLQNQLRQSAGRFVFWKSNVAYYQNSALPNAKSIVENASKAYFGGDIGYVEYAQALQTNLEIQRSYLEAVNSLNQTVVFLKFLINQ